MKHMIKFIATLVVCFTSSITVAQGLYGGFAIGTSFPQIDERDVGDYSDDEVAWAGKLLGGYEFTEHWSLELGYIFYEKINYDSKRDLVGTYEVHVERQDIYIAPVFEIDPKGFLPLRFSAGLTYSKLKFNIGESFFNLAPSGKASTDDKDFGIYLSAGFRPFKFKYISSLVAAEYIHRNEMFDDSINPINSSEFMLSFSVMLH